jgi:uncharacterized protein (TIGR02466 family)
MNTIPLHHSDVFTIQNVGTEEQRTQLKTQILHDSVTNPSTGRPNDGCWLGDGTKWDFHWVAEQVCDLADKAVEHYQPMDIAFPRDKMKYKLNIWGNVNDPNSRNIMHSHRNAVFSAVYYIQGTNTGHLRLINPANILNDCNTQAPFVRDFYFTPKDGDLILWPAWVPHEVEINHSDKQRINLVFDIYFAD